MLALSCAAAHGMAASASGRKKTAKPENPRCPVWAGWVIMTLLTEEMKESVGKMASPFFKNFPELILRIS